MFLLEFVSALFVTFVFHNLFQTNKCKLQKINFLDCVFNITLKTEQSIRVWIVQRRSIATNFMKQSLQKVEIVTFAVVLNFSAYYSPLQSFSSLLHLHYVHSKSYQILPKRVLLDKPQGNYK